MSFWLLVDVLFEIPGFLRVRSHDHYPPINSSTLADRGFSRLLSTKPDVFRCFQGPIGFQIYIYIYIPIIVFRVQYIYIYVNLPEANPIVPWYPHFQRRVTQLPFFFATRNKICRSSPSTCHGSEGVGRNWGMSEDGHRAKISSWKCVTLWLCQNSYWKWPFIVDFPIKNGDVQ